MVESLNYIEKLEEGLLKSVSEIGSRLAGHYPRRSPFSLSQQC